MKKVKYAFFAFQPSDCEAAQLWLTRLYAQGWELEHLPIFAFLPAQFIPRTRDDVKYCVDLTRGVRDPNFAPDGFDQLVKESGWALVGTARTGLDVYKSLPGRDPIPIQTDPALFKKAFFRRELLPILIGGLIVGYIALAIETYLKVPKWAQALMPMMIIPLLSAMLGALIMFFVLGTPLVMFTAALTNFITGLDQSQKALYGFIIGWIGCIDYGGAISKVPNLICDGLMADGIYGPEGIKVLAAMVPPIGVTLGWLLSKAIKKPIFKATEEENIKVAFPMGICMISEGVIPIAMNDLIRTVICTSIGCGVCGAISFSAGVESMVPSGGVFVIPAMTNPLMAVVALLVGSCVTAVLLVLIKKRLTPEQVNDLALPEDDTEEEVDLSGFSLS